MHVFAKYYIEETFSKSINLCFCFSHREIWPQILLNVLCPYYSAIWDQILVPL